MQLRQLHLVVAFILAIPSQAFGQLDTDVTELVPDGDIKTDITPERNEWDGTLTLNGNISLAQNSNVVGQLDGFSFLFGLGVVGTLDYVNGPHEWNNKLGIAEAWAKTPVLDDLVKNNDTLSIESLYAYYFLKWLGAFGRIGAETAIFNTMDFRADPVDYSISLLDGTQEVRTGQTELRLASSLEPLTLQQSVGAIAKPIGTEPISVRLRAGVGGRETIASGVLVIQDDDATAPIEVLAVDDVVQAGAELAAGANGKFPAQRLSYTAEIATLIPVLNNDKADRPVGDLIRVGFLFDAAFSMFEWMSLIYQLRIMSDPQLIDATQIQNNLLLSFQYTLIGGKEEAPPPEDPEIVRLTKAIEDAKSALEDAEERLKLEAEKAKVAEEKARLAEERAKQAEPEPAPEPEGEPKPEDSPNP